MFGAEETAKLVRSQLLTLPEITIVGDRIHFLPAVPHNSAFPVCLIYPRITAYDSPINGRAEPTTEILQWEIRFIDQSPSADRIRPLARASARHFATDGAYLEATVDGEQWVFELEPASETEMPHLMEGTDFYSQRGTIYNVTINRIGG